MEIPLTSAHLSYNLWGVCMEAEHASLARCRPTHLQSLDLPAWTTGLLLEASKYS